MLKSDLPSRLIQHFPRLSEKEVEAAVNLILATMQETLARGDRIEIRDFGSFCVNVIPPRTGRNPKTGESVHIPIKHRPHFKPGKTLRERVAAAALSVPQAPSPLR